MKNDYFEEKSASSINTPQQANTIILQVALVHKSLWLPLV